VDGEGIKDKMTEQNVMQKKREETEVKDYEMEEK
jgi:hypothetical protein